MIDDPKQKVLDALFAGDAAFLTAVLREHPSAARASTEAGVSAIRVALYAERAEMVAAILECDPELDLFDAAALGRNERCEMLCDADETAIATRSGDGFTALHLAAFFGHEATVRALLARGASVLAVSENAMKVHALHSAVAKRHLDIARLLLDHGADPDAPQMGGWTPLHAAVKQENLPLIRLLLAHGADPTRAANDGRTPLHLALEARDPAVRALVASTGGDTAR